MTVNIGSAAEFRQILSSSSVVVTDFYADWCGPCKMIAPVFESLSTKFSKPGRVTFCKVNVDNQREVAQTHGVTAMPTFIIFRNGAVAETLRGANPPALTSAVEKAVKLAGPGAGGSSFGSGGQRLGGGGDSAATQARRQAQGALQRPLNWDLNSFINTVIVFVGLYLVSLFAFDPFKAAEASKYNVKNPPGRGAAPAGGQGAKPGAAKPTFRTLADMGGD